MTRTMRPRPDDNVTLTPMPRPFPLPCPYPPRDIEVMPLPLPPPLVLTTTTPTTCHARCNRVIDPRTYTSMYASCRLPRPHISGNWDIQAQAVLGSDGQSQKSANFRLREHTDNSSCAERLSLISPSLGYRLSDYDKSEAVAFNRDGDMKTLSL